MLLRICSRSIRFFPKRQEQNDPARQLFPAPASKRTIPSINRSVQKNRPHDPASTTARSGLNDRTIQSQRPHDSAPTSAHFRKGRQKAFSPSLHLLLPEKKKRLRAFLKTFRALRENISANETKRFGVFRRPGNSFPLQRQRTDCRPPASSSFPDHAGSFQEKGNGQNCHFVHQYDIFSVVTR